jgi:hypothetical protein
MRIVDENAEIVLQAHELMDMRRHVKPFAQSALREETLRQAFRRAGEMQEHRDAA